MLVNSFKNNVVKGKLFVLIAVLFSVLVRLLYYFLSNNSDTYQFESEGYLWKLIDPVFNNLSISLIFSFISTVCISSLIYFINVKYSLIRVKTTLPITLSILVFNSHPAFLHMNPYYIGAICILLAISSLFGSYSSDKCELNCLKITFIISFGGLFVPFLLAFIPVFWIGLIMVRSFKLKSILASIFAIFIVFLPVFSYFLFTDNLDAFTRPFLSITFDQLLYIPLIHYDKVQYIILGFFLVILAIVLIHNYLNSYKDKIRVRALISFLSLLAIVSLLFSILVNVNYFISIYVLFVAVAFLLSHLFAVVESKWYVYLYQLLACAFIIFCFFTFVILQ